MSFEDAAAGEWGLPKTVGVKLENGGFAEGDVTWDAVEGFDASATSAQQITVKVAAPTSDDSGKKDDAEKDDAEKDDADTTGDATKTQTTTTTTKAASKKGTPSTGDVTWDGFAGLLAVAAVCLVVARVSRRNRG